jgi:hypothetical protein
VDDPTRRSGVRRARGRSARGVGTHRWSAQGGQGRLRRSGGGARLARPPASSSAANPSQDACLWNGSTPKSKSNCAKPRPTHGHESTFSLRQPLNPRLPLRQLEHLAQSCLKEADGLRVGLRTYDRLTRWREDPAWLRKALGVSAPGPAREPLCGRRLPDGRIVRHPWTLSSRNLST